MAETRAIAEFVVNTSFADIPARAIRGAKEAILDSVGVALAGSQDDPGRIAADLARDEGARAEAAVFGQGFRTSAMLAALVNGAAAHALDFDASFAIMGQPTAGLAPAVFALGEPLGVSGRRLLEAYVAGFEVTAKLAWSMPEHWGEGGWHATATLGSFGCTAAASRLLGLDADQALMALGIVSSMAGGVVANFGTMSKPLHAGLAARNGLLAAKLAQRGWTGGPSVLDAHGGFYAAFAPGMTPNPAPFAELGKTFDLENGVRFKAYPCGGLTHSAVDALLALRREHHLAADSIERIDVAVTKYTASRIVYRIPETALQGKFSMAYILARTALDGELTVDTFSEEAIRVPAVLALAEKVHMAVDPALEHDTAGGRPARVTVHLRDGRSLSGRVNHPKGGPESPLADDELRGKFSSCARRVLGEGAASDALRLLDDLENVENVSTLSNLLLGGKGA